MPLIVIVDDRATNRTIYSKLALTIGEGVKARAFGDPHLAQSAHADLGDAASGLDAAAAIDAGVDDDSAGRVMLDIDAQRLGVADQVLDQGRRQTVDARP